MGTRNHHNWKLDNQGEYPRQIGWKHSRNDKLMQHKFRLGIPLADICSRLHDEYFGDNLHPNEEGAKIIAEEVFKVLTVASQEPSR